MIPFAFEHQHQLKQIYNLVREIAIFTNKSCWDMLKICWKKNLEVWKAMVLTDLATPVMPLPAGRPSTRCTSLSCPRQLLSQLKRYGANLPTKGKEMLDPVHLMEWGASANGMVPASTSFCTERIAKSAQAPGTSFRIWGPTAIFSGHPTFAQDFDPNHPRLHWPHVWWSNPCVFFLLHSDLDPFQNLRHP